jgi:hypothetical protein
MSVTVAVGGERGREVWMDGYKWLEEAGKIWVKRFPDPMLVLPRQGSHHREWLRMPWLVPWVPTDQGNGNTTGTSWKVWRSIMDCRRLPMPALVGRRGTVTYGPITYYCGPVIRVSCASPPQTLPPALPKNTATR